ncbi:hydantoinase B/oxoprolinase family protein [Ketogulonicigenium vulgare]|uniref:hydantoinase B/oxoprolinase family protein n=1 Tax=Ketogulonicigenium vulgare TaxID=92945 RepID=UPI0001E66CDD|nr:hydantoinase B/oxoprolinase family protein [Ketogulonicigenium vulgare]ADO41798.1 5-oxoprolinase (ATP-hydrolyzing) [Ketogulonicigenium vulgare Y25]ALJ80234.1 5-oxoprolinase [Ketogulonicigenium vulgare]ANW33093.1 5-oxoprolinase [Ketogulonicigenium vulgare]AOZ53728.1 5-oxoprolinase (ATP-hydrolyzing) [Ketogulonicigenium vulgare]
MTHGPQTAPQIADPIAFQLFRHAITGIANEMALTIFRTAYSGVLKNIMDYSTAICDREGRLAAQGLSLPGHLCSIPVALKASIAAMVEPIVDGDILVMNDPYSGGMHLPDIFIFKPVFVEDQIVAWCCAVCHHTDVGGRVAGSNAADSTEIFQEGIRIPPLKLFRKGVEDATLMAMLRANVRMPERLDGDLRGQLAACRIADQGLQALVRSHGRANFMRLVDDLLNYSEILTREALKRLPDGEATFVDYIDDDGVDIGKPIKLVCTVRKTGDKMVVDWTGSAPQVKGAINNTYSYTAAAAFTAVKTVLGDGAPNNDGCFRAVEVIAPPGTITNALMPAACAARGLTGFRLADCAFGALAKLAPGRVFACGDGGNTNVSIGGYTAERKPFIFVDFVSAAWGARPWKDGLEGNTTMFANMASYSTETVESENPLIVTVNEFVDDSAGAGKYRGGTAMRRDWMLLEDEATLSVRADRQSHAPYGLDGGHDGAFGINIMTVNGAAAKLTSKFTMTMRKGDVFTHHLPSGGGYGDPLERDPAAVFEDWLDDYCSVETARDIYGVILTDAGVDLDATTARRALLRAA